MSNRRKQGRVVMALLALYYLLAVSAVRDKSFTFDEVAHLVAGASCWRTADYRLEPENGILHERLAGLATLGPEVVFPPLDQPAWWNSKYWQIGDQFFFQMGNDATTILWRARAGTALFGVALALLVYLISLQIFGSAGALLSLLLCVLCPNLLGHGALVTSDVPAAFFFLASLWCLWVVLHQVSPLHCLASIFFVTALILTKNSAVLLLPMSLLLVLLRFLVGGPLTLSWRQRTRTVACRWKILGWLIGLTLLHVLAIWLLIWLAYGFRFAAFADAEPDRDTLPKNMTGAHGTAESMIEWARDHRLLPEAYLYGLKFTIRESQERHAFLNGQHGTQGWTSFFPYAFLVKTPLPVFFILALSAAAGVVVLCQKGPEKNAFWQKVGPFAYQTAPLWTLWSVYWIFALGSHLNIGHRHLLPTYPPLFVLAGGATYWLRGLGMGSHPSVEIAAPETGSPVAPWHRALGFIVVIQCGWLVLDSLTMCPDYLAYFNPIAGGPSQGYHHLVDSSLDWGQDLPGLKKWLDRQDLPANTPVYLSYFGSARPEYYGIQARLLPGYFDRHDPDPKPLQPGIYCISATMLQGVYLPNPGWNKHHEDAYQMFPEGDTGILNWPLLRRDLRLHDSLRFGRLCANLRRRAPDDYVGYSILIYRVSASELRQILYGPAPPG